MKLLEIVIVILAWINLLMTYMVLFRLHQPTTVAVWAMKVMICGLSPILFIAGIILAVVGLLFNAPFAMIPGFVSAILYLVHIMKVTQAPDPDTGFEQAFGPAWESIITPEIKNHLLPRRYVFRLPASTDPIVDKDIAFHTIPESGRKLLCDIWNPSGNVVHSGLAFIYLHGSAWTSLDKDYGTRPFFKRLVSQGHVVMDVAYRLFPETDFMGMIHDAKHAIAWMKEHAGNYGVDPEHIVIGGGSAGAHIALLAAYTYKKTQYTPKALEANDFSVQGVVSLYGQSDLSSTYYHTCQHLTDTSALAKKKNDGSNGMPQWMQKSMGKNFHRLGLDKEVQPGMLVPILGGTPDEKPEQYAMYSPITHVSKDCPPTLFIHGKFDILAPVKAIQHLYECLRKNRVQVVMHLWPQIDHAFDLILPRISPSAHNAIYDVERFLAFLASKQKESARPSWNAGAISTSVLKEQLN